MCEDFKMWDFKNT